MTAAQVSKAWSWRHAVTRSGLDPTTRHLLLTLSVCMDGRGQSCFPSVSDLEELTGLARRTIITHLAKAEEAGWIKRGQHGYRGQKWKRAEYEAVWPGRETEKDAEGDAADAPPSDDEEAVQQVHEGGAAGAPEVVQQVHQDKDQSSNHSKTSPVEREARAREEQKPPEPTEADRKRFTDGVALWPNLALDDSDRAFTAWWMLDEAKRIASLDRLADFVALHRAKKRDHLPALSTYFRQLRWEGLPPKADDGGGMSVPVPAYSEAWCMAFFETALSDRPNAASKARSMIAEAEFGKALWLRSGEIPQPSGWPKIARGDEAFMAWRKRLAEKSIWLKPESFGAWLWVPTEFPQSEREQAG